MCYLTFYLLGNKFILGILMGIFYFVGLALKQVFYDCKITSEDHIVLKYKLNILLFK